MSPKSPSTLTVSIHIERISFFIVHRPNLEYLIIKYSPVACYYFAMSNNTSLSNKIPYIVGQRGNLIGALNYTDITQDCVIIVYNPR